MRWIVIFAVIFCALAALHRYEYVPIITTTPDGQPIYGVPSGIHYIYYKAFEYFSAVTGIVMGLAALGILLIFVNVIKGQEEKAGFKGIGFLILLGLVFYFGGKLQAPSGMRYGPVDQIHEGISADGKSGTGALNKDIKIDSSGTTQEIKESLGVDVTKVKGLPVNVWWLEAILLAVAIFVAYNFKKSLSPWWAVAAIGWFVTWKIFQVMLPAAVVGGIFILREVLKVFQKDENGKSKGTLTKTDLGVTGGAVGVLLLIGGGFWVWNRYGLGNWPWKWIFWGIMLLVFLYFGYHFIQDRNKVLDAEEEKRKREGRSK